MKGEKVVNLRNRAAKSVGMLYMDYKCNLLVVRKAKYPFALPSTRL